MTKSALRLLGQLPLVCVLAGASTHAQAFDDMSALTVHGFGTFGLARSSSDQVEFVRDLSQPGGAGRHWSAKIDSVFGLQANLRLSERIDGVAQAVSRYRHDGSFRPELTWGFLRFDPNPNWSLRAGRLGTEFYMLADSRLVGYSYLTVRPPNDYFGTLPFSHIDGIDGQATMPMAGGLVRGKLFAGVTREKAPLADRLWDLNGSRMTGGYLDYQSGSWQWRAGYSEIQFKHELPIADLLTPLRTAGAGGAADALSVIGKQSRFYSAGAVYDSGPLRVELMLNRTRQESAIFEHSRAGYLIGGYRLGQVTPFAGYSWAKSSTKHLATGIPILDSVVADTMADSHLDQHTTFVGARWDFRRNMALKAQLDVIRGSPQSVFPYRWEKAGWNGRTNILSLALDFVF